jgi:hypothetical protein
MMQVIPEESIPKGVIKEMSLEEEVEYLRKENAEWRECAVALFRTKLVQDELISIRKAQLLSQL